MPTIILEIRAAEGGAHAKRLVKRQADIYRAYARNTNLTCSTIQEHL